MDLVAFPISMELITVQIPTRLFLWQREEMLEFYLIIIMYDSENFCNIMKRKKKKYSNKWKGI